ncbi:MAG: DUF4019 domain-containing protein [Pyrinomonadaceae bacterium]
MSFLLATACNIEPRRAGLPPEAQAIIDRTTADVAAGRFDEIHADAADEWRAAATPEQSRQALERVRAALGTVESRTMVSGREQQSPADAGGARTLVVTYNTRFERANGMETFTIVERDGRWKLARYFVNSDALKR